MVDQARIEFKVQGSAPEPYTIRIIKIGERIRCSCDCQAGRNGQACKHWKNVFFGIKQDYIDISQKELDEIRLWYDNSDLKEVFDKLNEIEKEMNKLKIAKKEIQELLNHTMKEVS